MIRRRWRGRREEQVANARDNVFLLFPASDAPAEQTRRNYEALLPGQDTPLVGENVPDDDPYYDR